MAKCREYHMSTNGNTRVAIRAYDVHISQHAVRSDDFKTLSGINGNWLLNSRFGAAEYRLMLFRRRYRAKPPAK